MEGNVIKSFLVSLGFDVDDASLKKFNNSIKDASLRVTALYGAISTAAAGIAYGIKGISESFEDLGYEYKIIAPAINKALILRQEMFKAYAATGINLTKVVQASVKLNLSITKTKYALDAIYKSVGSKFFALLTKQSDIFRQQLYKNMPRILSVLETFVHFIFKALGAIVQLGSTLWSLLTRVYSFFVALDKATDGWSTIILGVIAAWKLLNLSFLATPLGAIIALGVAILALYDDFKTFEEGGKSLFNWTDFIPIVDNLSAAFGNLLGFLKEIFLTYVDIYQMFKKLFNADWSGAFDSLVSALNRPFTELYKILELIKYIFKLTGSLAEFSSTAFGANGNAAVANFNNMTSPLVNPSNVQNSSTNQNVSQQTNITVQGSADATATGNAVANQQGMVNFNLSRNLKPSAQ